MSCRVPASGLCVDDSLSPVGAYCGDAVLTLCLRFREHAVGLKAAGRHHVSLKVVLAMNWLLLVDFSGATTAGEIPQKPRPPSVTVRLLGGGDHGESLG